jgi:peptide chain release factor 1
LARSGAACDLLGFSGRERAKGNDNPFALFLFSAIGVDRELVMLDKLAEVEKRYMELERMMSDPQMLGQQREYSKLAKERAEIEEIVTCYREWRKVEHEIHDNRQLMDERDEAIRELAKEEITTLRERKEALEIQLKLLILPKDPNDAKNVIVEIRAGTGGEEAALFAAELFRMY